MKKFVEDFKSFAMKGNVVDLAVGIIIGGAFGKIVTSLVNDIVMPVIGLLSGKVNFLNVGAAQEMGIKYGSFIQSVIDFIIVSLSIFLVIKAMSVFKKKEEEKPKELSKQEMLLEEIRDLLKEKNK